MLLGLCRRSSLNNWDTYVASLAPWCWSRFNEPTYTQWTVDNNFGSALFASWTFPTVPLQSNFGSTPIMPSDLTRTTVLNNIAGEGSAATGSPTISDAACCIFFAAKMTGLGVAAFIPWRLGGSTSGTCYIRFDGTFIQVQIRSILQATTINNSTVLNNVPHLIGVNWTSSSFDLWIDGVKVYTHAIAGTVTTGIGSFNMLQNGSNPGQKPYGNYGDQICWNRTLTDPECVGLYAAWN